jgi:hypothetical protein
VTLPVRSIAAALGLGLAVLAAGPPARAADPGPVERVVVRVGHEAVVSGTDLRIRLVAVTEDSRCPRPADCAWRGNGRVELDVAAGGARPTRIALHTLLKDHRSPYSPVDRYPFQARYAGLDIRILDLDPYPERDRPIRPDEYQVTLAVSRG